ncbi:MAG: hypothetical protein QXU61_00670, partial [Archaeoglobaceae archaeon]
MMVIFILIVFLFLYAPIAFVIYSSLFEGGTITLKWFEAVFRDDKVVKAFYNSLSLALLSTLTSVILGTMAAYAYLRTKIRLESL